MAPPSFRDALRYWFRLGWVNFGGPAGQVALMHRDLVERRRWIDEPSFLHGLDVCMLLPGPEAQQLATYVGWRLHGTRGGVAAGALFVLPSLVALLLLSWLYAAFGESPTAVAVLYGVKPVVLAIVLAAIWRLGQRALRTPLDATLAVLALAGITALRVPFPAIVAAAALVGLISANAAPDASSTAAAAPRAGVSLLRLARIATSGLTLWALPAAALLFAGQDVVLRLYLFFTRAAFVTFGGAYAVLAYVTDHAVANSWLDSQAMVDGLALAETTPGPLIIVLVFVGFLSAWNTVGPGWATVAGLATAWATFLPSTLIALAIGPYVEWMSGRPRIRRALGAVTAAVVGVIASLVLVLGRAALFAPDGGVDVFAALLASAALALLLWGLEPHWAVVAGAAVGLLRALH